METGFPELTAESYIRSMNFIACIPVKAPCFLGHGQIARGIFSDVRTWSSKHFLDMSTMFGIPHNERMIYSPVTVEHT